MDADAYFVIGDSHTVCQDYARAGSVAPGPSQAEDRLYAIVSDGCSSSADTDIGARFLTCLTVHALEIYGDHLDLGWVIWRAADAIRAMHLDWSCLDATLMCAFQRRDGRVRVMTMGDGVVVARRKSGEIDTWNIDFRGAPGYPSYLLDGGRLQHYLEEGFGERTVSHAVNSATLATHQCQITRDGASGGREAEPQGFVWQRVFDPTEHDLVLLLSDGAHSFLSDAGAAQTESVPVFAVVEQLAAIKSTKGRFVTRRCRRFLRRFCGQNGWRHTDDLGVAGIYLGGWDP